MIVKDIVTALDVEVAAGADGLGKTVTGGYASDLLSCVMAGAKEGNVWVTLQAHANVIAVAELLNIACVIITEGKRPDEETLAKANERGIPTLLAKEGSFTVVSKLVQLGVRGAN